MGAIQRFFAKTTNFLLSFSLVFLMCDFSPSKLYLEQGITHAQTPETSLDVTASPSKGSSLSAPDTLPTPSQKQAHLASALSSQKHARPEFTSSPQTSSPAIPSSSQATASSQVAPQSSATTKYIPNPNPCQGYYAYLELPSHTVCLVSTAETGGQLSYQHGYIYNSPKYQSYNQYIFGHNSAGLFAVLSSLPVGTLFRLTVANTTRTYRLQSSNLYCDYTNPSHPCSNYSEPVLNMFHVIRPRLKSADLSIMTCAGNPLSHGDATHRRVIYASAL